MTRFVVALDEVAHACFSGSHQAVYTVINRKQTSMQCCQTGRSCLIVHKLPSVRHAVHGGAIWLQIEQDLETVANSEHFFLFEESLRAVLLAVSRDPDLAEACCHQPFPTLMGTTANGDTRGPYPPSGLLPCR